MEESNFDKQFQEITKAMVEIAFEFVKFDTEKIDAIFVFCSLEENTLVYKFFYSVNGVVMRAHKAYEFVFGEAASSDYQVAFLRLGSNEVQKLHDLFTGDEREVPTLVKIQYYLNGGRFHCDLKYGPQYAHTEDLSYVDLLDDWFDAVAASGSR